MAGLQWGCCVAVLCCRFDLAIQLGDLEVAADIGNSLDTPAKWRQLGAAPLTAHTVICALILPCLHARPLFASVWACQQHQHCYCVLSISHTIDVLVWFQCLNSGRWHIFIPSSCFQSSTDRVCLSPQHPWFTRRIPKPSPTYGELSTYDMRVSIHLQGSWH